MFKNRVDDFLGKGGDSRVFREPEYHQGLSFLSHCSEAHCRYTVRLTRYCDAHSPVVWDFMWLDLFLICCGHWLLYVCFYSVSKFDSEKSYDIFKNTQNRNNCVSLCFSPNISIPQIFEYFVFVRLQPNRFPNRWSHLQNVWYFFLIFDLPLSTCLKQGNFHT